MIIRYIEKKDIAQVIDLEMRIFGETLGEEMLSSELFNDITKFWVAMDDDDEHVLGYIGGYFIIIQGELLNFVVDEPYQRQGIGQALLNEALSYAKKRNLQSIVLEVREYNDKAINFYKKNGFKPISKREHYYQNNESAIVMLKVIE